MTLSQIRMLASEHLASAASFGRQGVSARYRTTAPSGWIFRRVRQYRSRRLHRARFSGLPIRGAPPRTREPASSPFRFLDTARSRWI